RDIVGPVVTYVGVVDRGRLVRDVVNGLSVPSVGAVPAVDSPSVPSTGTIAHVDIRPVAIPGVDIRPVAFPVRVSLGRPVVVLGGLGRAVGRAGGIGAGVSPWPGGPGTVPRAGAVPRIGALSRPGVIPRSRVAHPTGRQSDARPRRRQRSWSWLPARVVPRV